MTHLMQASSALALVAILAVGSISTPAAADDATAKQLYAQAAALFAQRTDLSKIDQALQVLGQAEAQAPVLETMYDVLILESRSLYWKGQHTAGDENKKPIYLAGQERADKAGKLSTDYSEAPYFAGINLARWCEANGVMASIAHKGELMQYMVDAQDAARTTRDGKDGGTIDGYGPSRVLGRMYYKLPSILGGSHTESVKQLREASTEAPTWVLNVLYLVDTLAHGSSAEKTEATQLLDKLLTNDPNTFNVDRLPETLEEFQLATDYKAGKPLP